MALTEPYDAKNVKALSSGNWRDQSLQVFNLRDFPGHKMPPGCKRVDRLTPYGNPVHICEGAVDRTEAIWRFEFIYLPTRPDLIGRAKRELKGFHLGCWCHPKPCHARVWLRIANTDYDPSLLRHPDRCDAGACM